MPYASRHYRVGARVEPSPWLPAAALLTAGALGAISAFLGGEMALLLFLPVLPVMFVLRDLKVGVFLLIFLLPFQHTPFLPQFTGFNLVNYLMLATLLSLAFGRFYRHQAAAPFPHVFWWGYLLPIAFAAVNGVMQIDKVPPAVIEFQSIFYASPRNYLIGMVIKPLLMVLVAWMLACASMRAKKPERFIVAVLFSPVLPAIGILVFVALSGFDLKLLADEHARETLGGLGMHANEFGLLLSTSFTLMLFMMPAIRGGWLRMLNLVGMAIISTALLLTFSRGGYIVALFSILYFAAIHRQMRYVLLAVLMLLSAVLFAPDAFLGRISAGFEQAPVRGLAATSNDALTAGRIWMWTQLLPDFWHSPIWGSGVGSQAWSNAVQRGEVNQIHPHNLYLRILLDMGIAGLVLLGCFVYYMLRSFKKIARRPGTPPYFAALANGTRMALVGVLISGWANGQYISESELSVLWMAIGLLLPFLARPEQAKTTSDATAADGEPAR